MVKWVFCDEKTFNLNLRSSGQRVKDNEILILETVKHSEQVHCWWAISATTIFETFLFTDNLTADFFINILGNNLPSPYAGRLPRGYTLLMDNDPKHTANVTKQWLNVHVPNFTSDFPPQSPDLNPIENIWSVVADKVAEKPPKNLEALQNAIRKICFSIPREYILHAIDSMDAR